MASLIDRGLGQADLVLALLRLRDQRTAYSHTLRVYVELLMGHPIVVGPCCLLRYGHDTPRPRAVRSVDDRRIVHVHSTNPRQPCTPAHLRWCEYRVGRTLGQLYVRGVTRRDVRRALRMGWIKLEEMENA